jgi:hypothetical protein
MPSDRASSSELLPFCMFAIIQTAGSHFDSDSGESSKVVPVSG